MTPHQAHAYAREHDLLPMWTVYEKPLDFPNGYLARMHVVGAGFSGSRPTFAHVTGASLDEVRAQLPPGLCPLSRSPDDHPSIVETWI